MGHLRWQRAESRAGVLHCYLLDCSGSMMQGESLAIAKGVLLRLLQRAYRSRAQVALICFAAGRAELRVAPTGARAWSDAWVHGIGGGGGTPLGLGLARAGELLARASRERPAQQRWLWLLTDGRTPERPARPAAAGQVVVIDFERQAVRLAGCERLAREWGADYFTASELVR